MARARNRDVLILSLNGGAVGGVTRVAIRLAQGLRERGWNPEVLFPLDVDEASVAAWCADANVRWQRVPGLLPEATGRTWKDAFRLWKIVRKHPARIVNVHYGGSGVSVKDTIAIRLGRRKLVVTLHSPTPWSELGSWRRRMTGLSARVAHQLIGVTEPVADTLAAAGVARERVAVIPGGVPIPREACDRTEARRDLGVPGAALLITTVARCAPEKRLPDLVEAVYDLRSTPRFENVHLLIKGDDGDGTDDLVRLGSELLGNRFQHFGPSEIDNHTLYSATDVFCLPSSFEGYPLVLQEAAAYGLPAVSTRVGGIPSLVDHGVTGLLIEPGDRTALSAALGCLLSRPEVRERMGESARAKAEASFSQEFMADKYASIFAGLG